MAEGTFFKRIQEPVEFRKAILQASRDALRALQDYERYHNIKTEKKSLVTELKNELKDISILVAKLKQELPAMELKKTKKKLPAKKKDAKEEEHLPPEIASLSNDLAVIEKKLASLE